jgi:hypothetical protein
LNRPGTSFRARLNGTDFNAIPRLLDSSAKQDYYISTHIKAVITVDQQQNEHNSRRNNINYVQISIVLGSGEVKTTNSKYQSTKVK